LNGVVEALIKVRNQIISSRDLSPERLEHAGAHAKTLLQMGAGFKRLVL
jgi:hypothetical protein